MAKSNNKKSNDSKPAVSFDEMIKADRTKRKAEALAQEIFGKNRRQSAPITAGNTNNSNKKATPLSGSLASRVGVTKRSTSTASLSSIGNQNNSSNNNNNRQNRGGLRNNRNGRGSQLASDARAAAVEVALQQKTQQPAATNKQSFANGGDNEISIRGAAGPYCVVASNFVPGTTAADIESVMGPVGGDMAGCKLLSTNPMVIAEMIFVDKRGADNVINMFNGKKADGRVLYVYLKEGGPSQPLPIAAPLPVVPRIASPMITNPEPIQQEGAEDVMEVEEQYPTEPSPLPRNDPSPRPSYSQPRENRASYREDYDRGPRQPQAGYQDGRHGFPDQRFDSYDRRPRYRDEGRMYSDDMMRGGGGGGGGGGRRGGRGGRYRG